MTSDKSMTRVRKWVQGFYAEDGELFEEIGENFEYYLNHVDELESGAFHYTDLPNLEELDKLFMHSSVLFGIEWGKENATLHSVSTPSGEFVGLYAHEENAIRHARSEQDSSTTDESLVDSLVTKVSPSGADARAELETFLNSDTEQSRKVGECLLYLLENEAEIEAQTKSPDDFPHFPQNVKWLITYSALFGRLWEFSHPGLWVVLDESDSLVELCGDIGLAKQIADETRGRRTQRVNVQDGDLPNSTVLVNVPGGS